MCGIAGIIAPDAKRFQSQLKAMLETLEHRGPDGKGTAFFDECALGHRRLKVVDLETGDQPMFDRSRNKAVVFNGEIYGYKEIRKELKSYPFQTASDTEVILALDHLNSEKLCGYLPGMFAFALWDDDQKELRCGRDRFGEKPFYYATGKNGEFIFASEIKAILASNLIEPVLDEESLAHYLKWLYVHPSRTIYKNVHVLAPAHRLTYRDGCVNVSRYWDLPKESNKVKLEDAVPQFGFLLEQAVKRQLVADVPVGAFLSGGLDSSTVVALAARHSPKIKTFSFGFGESINELPFARQIAQKYGTEHFELEAPETGISELMIQMQEVYDEPFADSSNIPTYLISKLCRRHTKVVLTGDGGDELLGGYSFWYRSLFNMETVSDRSSLTRLFLKSVLLMWQRFQIPLPWRLETFQTGLLLHSKYSSVLQAHKNQSAYFTDAQLTRLGIKAESQKEGGKLSRVLREDLTNYLPGDILTKTDRASMAHGLELRAPFLDVDFASFCLQLPLNLKITSSADKLILREAFAEAWTPEIQRRSKQGFGAPVGEWLKREDVKDLTDDYLNQPQNKIYSILSYEEVKRLSAENNYKTWILLVLSLWMEKASSPSPLSCIKAYSHS